jgi:hypothetical protein
MSESTSPSHLRGISPARRPSPEEPVTSSDLVERVSSLIDQARESIASYANATLTMTYWQVGSMIDAEVLNEERAEYGAQILATLSRELVERFGRGFEEANLRRIEVRAPVPGCGDSRDTVAEIELVALRDADAAQVAGSADVLCEAGDRGQTVGPGSQARDPAQGVRASGDRKRSD